MGKCKCISRQNDQSVNFKIFRSFESSIKTFDNIFGNIFSLMNIVLLKFLIFCYQAESVRNGWKFLAAKWTELALYRYSLVVHIHKETCFGLSLTHRMSFKICSHFSENGIFEKFVKILFPQKRQLFECFSIWSSGSR